MRRRPANSGDKGIAATDIAKMLGVSRATVYRYLADDAAFGPMTRQAAAALATVRQMSGPGGTAGLKGSPGVGVP